MSRRAADYRGVEPEEGFRAYVMSRVSLAAGFAIATFVFVLVTFCLAAVTVAWLHDVRHDVRAIHDFDESSASNDVAALQYALFVDRAVLAHCECGPTYVSDAVLNGLGYPAGSAALLVTACSHQAAQVAALEAAINDLGEDPVPECVYPTCASIGSSTDYLAGLRELTAISAAAYDGVSDSVTDASQQELFASIAAERSRRAAFVNVLTPTGDPLPASPYPDAFGTATQPQATIDSLVPSDYITSCPYTPDAPTTRPTL